MARFHYKAISATGATIRGVTEAPSSAAVLQQLRAQGHYPVALGEKTSGRILAALLQLRDRAKPSLRGLSILTQEFAALLGAGLELDRALGILIKLKETGAYRVPLEEVREQVRDGSSLADALAANPVFPKYYVGLVRAGEFGGTLEASLKKLSDYLSRSLAVRESIASALVYPILLLITAGLSVTVILVFVLPEFEPLFAGAGRNLPLATRMVMGISDLVRTFWWLIGLIVAGIVLGVRQVFKDETRKQERDKILLRIPVLGSLLEAMETERLCRILGTLVANGVPLPTALTLAGETLGNRAFAIAVRETARSLREGDQLATRLAQARIFPPVLLDLVQIGEETGKLDDMLLRQADLDEQKIRHTTDRLLAILVPALTIVLGFVVAGLIASMLVAILSINDLALG